MSLQSTTTWTYELDEPFLWAKSYPEEGTALYFFEHLIFVALFPKKKIETSNLQELSQFFVQQEPFLIPKWVGCITYEQKAIFYQPSTIICFDRSTQKATLYGKSCSCFFQKKNKSDVLLSHRSDTKESFLSKVKKIQDAIFEGDVYQVNLSQSFTFSGTFNAIDLFQEIYHIHPTPYAAFLQLEEQAVLSFSPELFFQTQGQKIITKPIKGTMARGLTEYEDQKNLTYLRNSEKEQAELLMITDLLRNDLNKFCKRSTVIVKELFQIAKYPTLFQQYSTIEGEWQDPEIFASLFPGGSVTGCPKEAAKKMITQLEPYERGIYTGTIGFVLGNGDHFFNIAIRSLELTKEICLKVGAAITTDSDPLKEYEETLVKARFALSTLGVKEHDLY